MPRIVPDPESARIADVIVSTWRALEAAVGPVVGPSGIAALYARSLYIAGADYSWLGGTREPATGQPDIAALRRVLAEQSSARAAAGAIALLRTLHASLLSLIGSSLTEKLLCPVWAHFLSCLPPHEPSP